MLEFDTEDETAFESIKSYINFIIRVYSYRIVKQPKTYQIDCQDSFVDCHMNSLYEDTTNNLTYYLTVGKDNFITLQSSTGKLFSIRLFQQNSIVGTSHRASKYGKILIDFNNDLEELKLFSKEFSEWKSTSHESVSDTCLKVYVYIIDREKWKANYLFNVGTLENIYIAEEIKSNICERLKLFTDEYERSKKFGKPHKFNMLFYGVPGSGKTSLVKALAKKLNKKLYLLNLSKELTDNSLIEILTKIEKNSILVIEDIDSFFIGRESTGCNISFSTLINQLDGIQNSDSSNIMILTANHVDKLDPALLRQGRIDLIVKFDYPTKEEIQQAFNAYTVHLTKEEQHKMFKEWYMLIKNKNIPMSAITDHLYRNYKNCIEKTPELLKDFEHLKSIQTNIHSDKMYS